MLEITTISNQSGSAAARLRQFTTVVGKQWGPAYQGSSGDRVELTPAAQNFGSGPEAAPTLGERINDLRGRIESGTYLTPDKIDYVVGRLQAELFGALPDVA